MFPAVASGLTAFIAGAGRGGGEGLLVFMASQGSVIKFWVYLLFSGQYVVKTGLRGTGMIFKKFFEHADKHLYA